MSHPIDPVRRPNSTEGRPFSGSSFFDSLRSNVVVLALLSVCWIPLDCICLAYLLPWLMDILPRGTVVVVVAVTMGLLLAQLLLAAALAALGDGNHVARSAVGAIIVFSFTMLMARITCWLRADPFGPGEAPGLALFVLFGYCLLQLPFWLLRYSLGWRLGTETIQMASARFDVAHVFGWSALLMLPLFLYRLFESIDAIDLGGILHLVVAGVFVVLEGATFVYLAGRCTAGMALFVAIPMACVNGMLLYVVMLPLTQARGTNVAAALVAACLTGGLLLIGTVQLLDRFAGVRFSTRRVSR